MSDCDAYQVLNVRPDAHQLVLQAAYRVLAALYHPDRGDALASPGRMAELNAAYALVRSPEARAAYDAQRTAATSRPVVVPSAPSRTAARQSAAKPRQHVIDFGRYQGWTIPNVARHDPDYLRWLSRHSAGTRYRAEISAALAAAPTAPTASEKVYGRR